MAKILSGSDKMQVKGIGELQGPSAFCASCGNGTCEAGYIDTGIYYEYEGQVYLCMSCVTEVAETSGMLSMEESNFLQRNNEALAEINATLKAKVDSYAEQLKSYDNIISGIAERSLAPSNDPTGLYASEPTPSKSVSASKDGKSVGPTVGILDI